MRITAHCIVKNEDQWIWFAIQSVLPFVDQIFVFDTGSTDKTVEIIKLMNNKKIIYEQKGSVDAKKLVDLRREQLDRTKTDWFMILDGDEIWPEKQFRQVVVDIESAKDEVLAVVNRVNICLGDIYHHLPDSAGNYQIKGAKGNLNIRFIKKTKDLKIFGEYPLEYYSNELGTINTQDQKLILSNAWYLHTSFLKRSSSDPNKKSGSLGKTKWPEKGLIINNQDLPEVFNRARPNIVPDPYHKRGIKYELSANILNPLIIIRRNT